jgi:hypothetical protein
MGDSFDSAINDIIEASTTATDFLSRLASRSTEMRVELPSVAERLEKEFFPTLSPESKVLKSEWRRRGMPDAHGKGAQSRASI